MTSSAVGGFGAVSSSASRGWRPSPSAQGTLRVWALALTLLIFYFVLSPRSANFTSINLLLQNCLPLAWVAAGQMAVLIVGQIDLSVGGVVSLATAIAATRMGSSALDAIVVSLAAILIGASFGVLNGFLVAYRRMSSFIVTIATWSIIDGAALVVLPSAGGIRTDRVHFCSQHDLTFKLWHDRSGRLSRTVGMGPQYRRFSALEGCRFRAGEGTLGRRGRASYDFGCIRFFRAGGGVGWARPGRGDLERRPEHRHKLHFEQPGGRRYRGRQPAGRQRELCRGPGWCNGLDHR